MKKEEKDYLVGIKHSEGLNYDEAGEEIKNLENSQKQFKILNREIKKKDTVIRNLKKKINSQEKTIKTLKIKKLKVKPDEPKIKKNTGVGKEIFLKDAAKEESTKEKIWRKYSERIHYNLEYEITYTKTDIIKEFMVPGHMFNWAIERLMKKDIVGTKQVDGITRYFKK